MPNKATAEPHIAKGLLLGSLTGALLVSIGILVFGIGISVPQSLLLFLQASMYFVAIIAMLWIIIIVCVALFALLPWLVLDLLGWVRWWTAVICGLVVSLCALTLFKLAIEEPPFAVPHYGELLFLGWGAIVALVTWYFVYVRNKPIRKENRK